MTWTMGLNRVTVRHGSSTAYKDVRARCESAPKMLAMGEGFVVYSIMDFVVDNYFPVIHELESEVDALEDAVFSRQSRQPDITRAHEILQWEPKVSLEEGIHKTVPYFKKKLGMG